MSGGYVSGWISKQWLSATTIFGWAKVKQFDFACGDDNGVGGGGDNGVGGGGVHVHGAGGARTGSATTGRSPSRSYQTPSRHPEKCASK